LFLNLFRWGFYHLYIQIIWANASFCCNLIDYAFKVNNQMFYPPGNAAVFDFGYGSRMKLIFEISLLGVTLLCLI
jgi:hypothetical protein